MPLNAAAFGPGGLAGLLASLGRVPGLRQLLEQRRAESPEAQREADLANRQGGGDVGPDGTGSVTGSTATANQGQGNAFGYSPSEFGGFAKAMGMIPGPFGLPGKVLSFANKLPPVQRFLERAFPLGITNDLGEPATRGFNPVSLSDQVRGMMAEEDQGPIGTVTAGEPSIVGIDDDPGFGIGESQGDPGPAGPGDSTGLGGEGSGSGSSTAGVGGEGDAYRRGGTVRKTGLARLHKGEEVVRRSEAQRIRPALKTINKPGASGFERLLQKGRA